MKSLQSELLNRFSTKWWTRVGTTLAAGLILGVTAGSLPIQRLEWLTEAFRLQLREKWVMKPPTGQVVLLAVDEKSLATQGQWPFTRSVHGQLMEWLGKAAELRPAVMSWDIIFTEETYDPALDRMFAEPLATAGYPFVMGAFSDPAAIGIWTQGRPAPRLGLTVPLDVAAEVKAALPDMRGIQIPIVPLLDVSKFALLDAEADEDGIIRKIPLLIRVGDRVFPSLVLGTLMEYWKVSGTHLEVRLGGELTLHTASGVRRIPIDERGYYSLNYRYELRDSRTPSGIETVSYQDVFDKLTEWAAFGDKQPDLPLGGKILVVGQTATGLTDLGPTPLRSESGKVLVHLNALENILAADYLRRLPVWPGLMGTLGLGLAVGWVLERRKSGYLIGVIVVIVLVGAVSWLLLIGAGVMIPMAAPLVAFGLQQTAITLLKIREEQAQRDRIRRMFGSYVSPELVRRMVDSGVEPRLGGHEAEITAFFSDIQGFSAFSEVLAPADLVQLLNEYLGSMTDILQEGGGALDKYIGDAIVAMFGGLVPLSDHARRACEATAKMQIRQAELRAKWASQGDRWPPLVHAMRTRIGVNSGLVVVGNMGSNHRFNYTMMGDTVNLTARCESGAKTFGAYAVATGATVTAAKAAGCGCVFRSLDRIVVKGRTEPVEIFEIVALSPAHLPEGAARCLERFESGRQHYLKQEWTLAIACFEDAATDEPLQPGRDVGVEANPSLLMQQRSRALLAKPPGADWDGVYRMTTK